MSERPTEPGAALSLDGGAGLVRVRLDLAYDGTQFAGWARQPGRRAVQSEVESALDTVLRSPTPPLLTAAGRTDAGVHARGQVAHLDLPANLPVIMQICATSEPESRTYLHDHQAEGGGWARLARSLNGVLAPDVRVKQVCVAPQGFDARFSALSRRYSYRVADSGFVDPLRRHDTLAWAKAAPLDVDAMNAAASQLLGAHDFAAFCRRREGASTVRGLLRFDWRRDAGVVIANVEADAFCHSMVRSMVGALLAVGDGRRDPGWPAVLLSKAERESSVTVVPPHGLTLEDVRYPDDDKLAARAETTRKRRG